MSVIAISRRNQVAYKSTSRECARQMSKSRPPRSISSRKKGHVRREIRYTHILGPQTTQYRFDYQVNDVEADGRDERSAAAGATSINSNRTMNLIFLHQPIFRVIESS